MDGERFTPEQTRDHWKDTAISRGSLPTATWADLGAVQLEIREILKHLRDGEVVLDVGCGNGYPAICYAKERKIRVKGVDDVPEMISAARKWLERERAGLRGEVEFTTGNILSPEGPAGIYDKLTVTRVLINLGSLERQLQALTECARLLRPEGTLLLCEASLQSWRNLNRLREEWGLPAILMPPFNLFLDEEQFLPQAERLFRVQEVSCFMSSYFVGTRFLKPLLARVAPVPVDVADGDMEWNRLMAALPPVGDYGKVKLFVLMKRS
jgi:ubiquinone/menaquinone biosynthesis C-methylase UbiE